VEIVGAEVPCGCIYVDNIPITLQPNATAGIYVRINTVGFRSGTTSFVVPLLTSSGSLRPEISIVLEIENDELIQSGAPIPEPDPMTSEKASLFGIPK
jgi:hypothetical protein